MAGEWIKMRVGLTTNPKVLRIAEGLLESDEYLTWSGLVYGVGGPRATDAELRAERYAALRVTRYVTVTALLKFWGYANEHAKGEFIAGVRREDLDEIVGVPGFSVAIESAGWAKFNPNGGLEMPNFGEHNASYDARSSGAERQKRYREKQQEAASRVTSKSDADSNVTHNVTVTPREEKRREENKEPLPRKRKSKSPATSLPDDFGISEGVKTWAERKGYTRLPEHLEAFRAKCKAKDYTYVDWDSAFQEAIRGDWAKLAPQSRPSEQPSPAASRRLA